MYLVFAGDHYYPAGGWRDFEGAFPSLEDAEEHAKDLKCDWWHIVHGEDIVRKG